MCGACRGMLSQREMVTGRVSIANQLDEKGRSLCGLPDQDGLAFDRHFCYAIDDCEFATLSIIASGHPGGCRFKEDMLWLAAF